MTVIENDIASRPERVQPRLTELYALLKTCLPDAEEKISWQMPPFYRRGNLPHFADRKDWIGLYPGGEATAVFADRLTGFGTTKGSIHLPYDQELPVALIRDLASRCTRHNGKQGEKHDEQNIGTGDP